MGQEVPSSRFNKQDFKAFEKHLHDETDLLQQMFQQQAFANDKMVAGSEMEVWLINRQGRPAPVNDHFLAQCHSDMIVPELAKFNIEFNSQPQVLNGAALSKLQAELEVNVALCRQTAQDMDIDALMIGILPTISDEDLTLEHMSLMTRFRALNEQVLRLRKGRPLHIVIQGAEHLRASHFDVMLESAATSFQIHLQVPQQQAVRFYNASCLVSAPLVAISANSPYFYGKDLWDETRIPLFEQSVSLHSHDAADCAALKRVTFGSGYVTHSLFEAFAENMRCFPVLLPAQLDSADALAHVRLHNGTIWRWNRPLIGYDHQGHPHLRIEQRVVAAGPSVLDSVANAAFYYGLVQQLATQVEPPEQQLEFSKLREGFYKAARLGLRASIPWLNGHNVPVSTLIEDELLPMARRGLQEMGVDGDDIERYLEIILARVRSGQNGAVWQRGFIAKNGRDMTELTAAYLELQGTGIAVHEWPL